MGTLTTETFFAIATLLQPKINETMEKLYPFPTVPLEPSTSWSSFILQLLYHREAAALWFPCPVELAGLRGELVIYTLLHRGRLCTYPPCGFCCLVAQLCATFCHPMDCSPPGSSVYGDSPGRILEWVLIPFSRVSSQPRVRTWVSPHCRQIFYHLSHQRTHP